MMKYAHVHLEAWAYVLPERVVSSAELEQRLAPLYERFGLHEGRLELMTGIRERRFWKPGLRFPEPPCILWTPNTIQVPFYCRRR